MTFSGIMMTTLRAVNGMPAENKAGILPVRDVESFKQASNNPALKQILPKVNKNLESMPVAGGSPQPINVNTHAFAPPGLEMS